MEDRRPRLSSFFSDHTGATNIAKPSEHVLVFEIVERPVDVHAEARLRFECAIAEERGEARAHAGGDSILTKFENRIGDAIELIE